MTAGPPRALLALLCVFAGCSDDAEPVAPPAFVGTTGAPSEMGLYNLLPTVSVDLGPAGSQPMIVDTGAPITVVATSDLDGLDAGLTVASIDTFGLTFPRLSLVGSDSLLVGDPECEGARPVGYLGADVFGRFALAMDYRGRSVSVLGVDDERPVFPDTGATPVTVPVEILGGGEVSTVDGDTLVVAATRVIVDVVIEGHKASALLDTGFSLNVVAPSLFQRLGDAESRPGACCQKIYLAAGGVTAVDLTRLGDVAVGDVVATNQPALVLGYPRLLDEVSAETGRNVEMILGAPFLQRVASVIDYENQTWTLSEYAEQDHVDSAPFVLPGFSFCKAATSGAGAKVTVVYNFTEAQGAGILAGDRLVEVDGEDMRDASADDIDRALRSGELGTVRDLTFETLSGDTVTHALPLEAVLEDYH